MANMQLMPRTNIEIDSALISKVMEAYGFKSIREAVDFALRELVETDPKEVLELEGSGWEGDLEALRGHGPEAAR